MKHVIYVFDSKQITASIARYLSAIWKKLVSLGKKVTEKIRKTFHVWWK